MSLKKPKKAQVLEKKQIIVVLRFDDCSSRSPIDLETKLIEDFKTRQISCTFGVIPFVITGNYFDPNPQDTLPLNKTKADILKNAVKEGILEVAQHGYSHQSIYPIGNCTPSGFKGLPYDRQREKILKGRQYLEAMLDTKIDTFIPPWNAYDLNTLNVLEREGFRTLSAGISGVVKGSSSLKFLPQTCNILELKNTIELVRHIPDTQPLIVSLFHPHEFLEINDEDGLFSYLEFMEILDWLTSQKNIRVMTIKQATKIIEDLSPQRLGQYRFYSKLAALVPWMFTKYFYSRAYLSKNIIKRLLANLVVLIASVIIILAQLLFAIVNFFTGFFVFS
jgi:peptidoglycan/xylan/chitin deacetylase (PgdA/CDA1 family)